MPQIAGMRGGDVTRRLMVCVLVALGIGCVMPAPHVPTPPSRYRLQVYVHDQTGAPLTSARVYRDNADDENPQRGGSPVGVGADGGRAWELPESGFNICGLADGYETTCVAAPLTQDLTLDIILPLASVPPAPIPDIDPAAWPPPAREPIAELPPIVEDGRDRGYWSHDPYRTTPLYDPPDEPSPDYLRGNFGPMPFPECDLPVVSGGYADRPQMAMSWWLPEYTAAQQVCILKGHQARGYTHVGLYWPFSTNQGVTEEAFVDALQRVHRAGLWTVVTLFGGDGEDWYRDVEPALERWRAAGAIRADDVLVVCWQCDGKYDPWQLAELTKLVADWAHAHRMFVALHWYSGRIAWWNAADDDRRPSTCYDATTLGYSANFCDRFQYGAVMGGLVDFQFQQFDPWSPIEDVRPREGGICGEVRDSARALFGRTKLVVAEYGAQRVEDQHAPEVEGDATGLLLLACDDGRGRGAYGGFFGGARSLTGEAVR